jgi:dinuclear metal center YbgI/SA1388 family protein
VPTLAQVVDVLDELYNPQWAADWDAVGLVCGDPDAEVRRVLFAVDPVSDVVDEAIEWGADLVVAHHPLFLRGVHGVAATTPKGRVVHRLLTHGIGLHVCHTNADVAAPGVSDALAAALGLTELRPLDPHPDVPGLGTGRLGRLPTPEPLRDFGRRVAGALPATAHGVRVAGDPDRVITTVAVCGGAGDSYLDVVRAAGADAYVTADLRHHPASEASEHGDAPALVDVAHWASEWPWLSDAADRLRRRLAERGTTVETRVSTIRTDPWRLHIPGEIADITGEIPGSAMPGDVVPDSVVSGEVRSDQGGSPL